MIRVRYRGIEYLCDTVEESVSLSLQLRPEGSDNTEFVLHQRKLTKRARAREYVKTAEGEFTADSLQKELFPELSVNHVAALLSTLHAEGLVSRISGGLRFIYRRVQP